MVNGISESTWLIHGYVLTIGRPAARSRAGKRIAKEKWRGQNPAAVCRRQKETAGPKPRRRIETCVRYQPNRRMTAEFACEASDRAWIDSCWRVCKASM